jgi:hypothetical protein
MKCRECGAGLHTDGTTGETCDPVRRGGFWRSGAFHRTGMARDPGRPDLRADNIGFRADFRIVAGK